MKFLMNIVVLSFIGFIAEYLRSIASKVVTKFTFGKSKTKSIQYILDGTVLNKSYTKYALDLLGIEYDTALYIDLINYAYEKQLEILEDNENFGFMVQVPLIELKAARDYLIDWCVYRGAVN